MLLKRTKCFECSHESSDLFLTSFLISNVLLYLFSATLLASVCVSLSSAASTAVTPSNSLDHEIRLTSSADAGVERDSGAILGSEATAENGERGEEVERKEMGEGRRVRMKETEKVRQEDELAIEEKVIDGGRGEVRVVLTDYSNQGVVVSQTAKDHGQSDGKVQTTNSKTGDTVKTVEIGGNMSEGMREVEVRDGMSKSGRRGTRKIAVAAYKSTREDTTINNWKTECSEQHMHNRHCRGHYSTPKPRGQNVIKRTGHSLTLSIPDVLHATSSKSITSRQVSEILLQDFSSKGAVRGRGVNISVIGSSDVNVGSSSRGDGGQGSVGLNIDIAVDSDSNDVGSRTEINDGSAEGCEHSGKTGSGPSSHARQSVVGGLAGSLAVRSGGVRGGVDRIQIQERSPNIRHLQGNAGFQKHPSSLQNIADSHNSSSTSSISSFSSASSYYLSYAQKDMARLPHNYQQNYEQQQRREHQQPKARPKKKRKRKKKDKGKSETGMTKVPVVPSVLSISQLDEPLGDNPSFATLAAGKGILHEREDGVGGQEEDGPVEEGEEEGNKKEEEEEKEGEEGVEEETEETEEEEKATRYRTKGRDGKMGSEENGVEQERKTLLKMRINNTEETHAELKHGEELWTKGAGEGNRGAWQEKEDVQFGGDGKDEIMKTGKSSEKQETPPQNGERRTRTNKEARVEEEVFRGGKRYGEGGVRWRMGSRWKNMRKETDKTPKVRGRRKQRHAVQEELGAPRRADTHTHTMVIPQQRTSMKTTGTTTTTAKAPGTLTATIEAITTGRKTKRTGSLMVGDGEEAGKAVVEKDKKKEERKEEKEKEEGEVEQEEEEEEEEEMGEVNEQGGEKHDHSSSITVRRDTSEAEGAADGEKEGGEVELAIPNSPTVVTRAGQTASLTCTVKKLGNRQLSWIRGRDLHVLSSGLVTFASDSRVRVSNKGESWTLTISYTQPRDAGSYACQVNTQPPVAKAYNLTVIEARARIHGQDAMYVQAGSTFSLECIVKEELVIPGLILWYHDDALVDRESGRIQVNTTQGDTTISRLRIAHANQHDSGNYSCWPSSGRADSVIVHIIQGEPPAAMQHANIAADHSIKFLAMVLVVTSVVLPTTVLLT